MKNKMLLTVSFALAAIIVVGQMSFAAVSDTSAMGQMINGNGMGQMMDGNDMSGMGNMMDNENMNKMMDAMNSEEK